MRKKKSFDVKRIKTKKDELYYSAGIPSRVWGSPKYNIDFKPIIAEDGEEEVKVGVKIQEEWYEQLITGQLFEDPYLIYLSSADADGLSDRIGYEVMKVALAKGAQVQVTNAGQIDQEETEDEQVFMLHNVFADANKYRLQTVRDWITTHEDCFRLVVISGPCPYAFSKLIYLKPDAMFKVDRAITKTKVSRA